MPVAGPADGLLAHPVPQLDTGGGNHRHLVEVDTGASNGASQRVVDRPDQASTIGVGAAADHFGGRLLAVDLDQFDPGGSRRHPSSRHLILRCPHADDQCHLT
ncbi:MAG: hypothetical protein FD127_3118 [Acidimicrobiaceae bacterium]|nr:MAG: hypothetical protein FD127_3118 [Acidimicrobiaceae bacterium]